MENPRIIEISRKNYDTLDEAWKICSLLSDPLNGWDFEDLAAEAAQSIYELMEQLKPDA